MIIIIDNYDSFTHNLYQSIAQHLDVQVIRNDKMSVKDLQALRPDGIILSPGPGRPEAAGICIELIQATIQTPLLGVCLGHQAITVAFGGKVIGAPEIVHGKQDQIYHQNKNLFEGLPLPFAAGRYHSLVAERESLPAELEIEAETGDGLIMALKHATRPLYGVQFHPESILTPAGNILLQNFINLCRGRMS